MATISIKNITKSYGKTEVIHGVSLDVADGEFIVIVGPSGCGKSTLLRMVAGLERITGGTIEIGGRVVNDLEPRERDIAMVFQNYALYPHMSVFDNMAYGLKIANKSKDEIRERVGKAARMLQLEPYLERKPRALSGGQRQRVAMGRALVRDPAVFLFDEPLSNLDAKLRVQMRLEIKEMQRSVETTALYVTHDQVEAMTLADRLVVMNGGVAEQIDTPMAVYDRPATRFVAGFIGSPAMNIMKGAASGREFTLEGGTTLPLGEAALSGEGRPVLFGVRPEHLRLVPDSEASIRLKVRAIETLGADTLAHGRFDGAGAEGGEFIARLPGKTKLAEGDLLPLAMDPGSIHLFDAESGKRI
ncbi:sn-glycerol-3-phosphate import ATP-binding protein UgpC [Nitratireductor indicus]|uniref:Glycerol-3-phosphate transporter ATP-binding subunit n=1 Tax=Nitratireductor indicus C115 TaxID=1231190 RepID=K2PPH8_9HYPH|nr:sn-glycerol-3-phosphate import ATP-binding protein UgpC [Nitratireductor indicus]EKF42982.1 glycerol-3-phosphate transporter ATP-binding subunit [Nitratireductor indicus C115]MDS1137863.1 sn-glycerol-3-phosphate import ATP-binding protein UgpC [Nitratireductor indicus]SFQ51684.1 sn-glycerol 3-phosphate transport system ATP-binding protein [Nitratireductor indicus]